MTPPPGPHFRHPFNHKRTKANVWSIRIRTTHSLSMWLYENFWMIILYGHLAYFILKVLAWEIWNVFKMRICQKSHKKVTKTVYVRFEFLWIRRYKAQCVIFSKPQVIPSDVEIVQHSWGIARPWDRQVSTFLYDLQSSCNQKWLLLFFT